jgi:hypothetical protein
MVQEMKAILVTEQKFVLIFWCFLVGEYFDIILVDHTFHVRFGNNSSGATSNVPSSTSSSRKLPVCWHRFINQLLYYETQPSSPILNSILATETWRPPKGHWLCIPAAGPDDRKASNRQGKQE